MGVDEMGVDEMGVDEMGTYQVDDTQLLSKLHQPLFAIQPMLLLFHQALGLVF